MPVRFIGKVGQLVWTCDFCDGAATDWAALCWAGARQHGFTVLRERYTDGAVIRWALKALHRMVEEAKGLRPGVIEERCLARGHVLASVCEPCQRKWWDLIMEEKRREP